MAFVLLPCDLPTWPNIEAALQPLQKVSDAADCCKQFSAALFALHSLCNVNIDPGGLDGVPEGYFEPFEKFLSSEVNLPELLRKALPHLVESALKLGPLKPPEGLNYSLQQQSDVLILSRPMVTSLLAHTFLSTLPRRSVLSHPTLCNPIMAPVLHELHSEDERVKVRAVLQYFALLAGDQAKTEGRVLIDRKVMGADNFLRLRRWRDSSRRLCQLQATGEPLHRIPSRPCLLACCCTAHPARAALLPHSIQDARGLEDHPELLVTGLLVEKLEDNEALQVTGVLSASRPHAPSPDDITYALLDADDYSENWILQYESINLLRELNKSYIAFSPPIKVSEEKALPTVPAGVIIKRALSKGVSVTSGASLSYEFSLPSSPASKGSIEKGLQFVDEGAPPPKGSSNDKKTSSIEKEEDKNIGAAGGTDGDGKQKREECSSSKGSTKSNSRSKSSNSLESGKKKLPKILELFLPKKLLASSGKRSVVGSTKSEPSSGIASTASESTSILSKTRTSSESGYKEIKEIENKSAGLVTAKSTLPEKSPKNKSEDKNQNYNIVNSGTSLNDPKDNKETGAVKQPATNEQKEGSTSDLLNRVLKAIQKLEQDQSVLLKNIPAHEIAEQDLIPKTDDLNAKSIARKKSKQPFPEGNKRSTTIKRRPPKAPVDGASVAAKTRENYDENAHKTKKKSSGTLGRKLSYYDSCMDEVALLDDEPFFSACESLDICEGEAVEEGHRRKGGRRERLPNMRRKSSFADRLKEAMQRGESNDSKTSQCSGGDQGHGEQHKTEAGKSSPGCPLDLDINKCTTEQRKHTRRSDTVLEFRNKSPPGDDGSGDDTGKRWSRKSIAGSDTATDGSKTEQEDEEEEDLSGSSRYSFSSDYTSDLEEVYDHLEEVLYQLEGATPGPRTAAIAQMAHRLLKRAFSESSKGLALEALDGGTLEDGSPAESSPKEGSNRPRSLSLQGGAETLKDSASGGCYQMQGEEAADLEPILTTEGVTILTESWGCDELGGDRQLKAMLQWAAASMAGAERVVYNTAGHHDLVKLGVLSRVLEDRQWTVGLLTEAVLRHCHSTIALWRTRRANNNNKDISADQLGGVTLFDRLLVPPKETKPKESSDT